MGLSKGAREHSWKRNGNFHERNARIGSYSGFDIHSKVIQCLKVQRKEQKVVVEAQGESLEEEGAKKNDKG